MHSLAGVLSILWCRSCAAVAQFRLSIFWFPADEFGKQAACHEVASPAHLACTYPLCRLRPWSAYLYRRRRAATAAPTRSPFRAASSYAQSHVDDRVTHALLLVRWLLHFGTTPGRANVRKARPTAAAEQTDDEELETDDEEPLLAHSQSSNDLLRADGQWQVSMLCRLPLLQ